MQHNLHYVINSWFNSVDWLEINDVLYHKRIIEDFEPELQGLFNYYLDNGKYPEYSYKGWTFEKIEEHTHYDVFRVFIQMNKIMTDEEYCDLFGYMSFGIK